MSDQATNPAGRRSCVVSSSAAPRHLKRLREWFVAEWGEVDSLEGQRESTTILPPLLAIDSSELLGGLMFSSFQKPDGEALGLWINALFVAREHRRKGIASQLVRAAEAEVACAGARELFALTDVPRLYQKLGWRCMKNSSEGTVVGALLKG